MLHKQYTGSILTLELISGNFHSAHTLELIIGISWKMILNTLQCYHDFPPDLPNTQQKLMFYSHFPHLCRGWLAQIIVKH